MKSGGRRERTHPYLYNSGSAVGAGYAAVAAAVLPRDAGFL